MGDSKTPIRDFIGYGASRPAVRWPNNASVAVSLVVNHEEGAEYSLVDGDERNESLAELNYAMAPEYRDLNAESVFEYGARTGVFRLLNLLKEYRLQATFFASGLAMERNLAIGQAIREMNHEPCGHGYRWNEQWLLDIGEERRQIRAAIDSLEATCGQRPIGWFSRYSASVNTRALLVEEGGFLYDSDAFNDDLPYFVTVDTVRHLVIPYSLVHNDVRYVVPQGYGDPEAFVRTCTWALDELLREGRAGRRSMMSIGLHSRWSGQPARSAALRAFIEHALGQGDVWFARRCDIAEWWIEHHLEFENSAARTTGVSSS